MSGGAGSVRMSDDETGRVSNREVAMCLSNAFDELCRYTSGGEGESCSCFEGPCFESLKDEGAAQIRVGSPLQFRASKLSAAGGSLETSNIE